MSSTLQRCFAARLIVAALLTVVSPSCRAQDHRADSSIRLGRYAHTARRIQDAVFDGANGGTLQMIDSVLLRINHLPPAVHLEEVVADRISACNNDRIWNMQCDILSLNMPPRYYQTRWFFALMIAIGLMLVMTIFIIRLQIMVDFMQAQFRERLAERDRIARELHDALLQGLHGVMLRLQAGVGMIRPDEPSRVILEDALDRADQVIIEGRRSIQDLRSERDASLGIADQFERLLNDLRLGNGRRCEVIVTGTPKALSPGARSELFAVGREAITNAFQHAKAASIIIELKFGKRHLQFACRDDGVGLPPDVQTKRNAPGHWGLVEMRERALKLQSTFDLRGVEPHGTSVELKVPARIAYSRIRWRGLWRMLGQDVL